MAVTGIGLSPAYAGNTPVWCYRHMPVIHHAGNDLFWVLPAVLRSYFNATCRALGLGSPTYFFIKTLIC